MEVTATSISYPTLYMSYGENDYSNDNGIPQLYTVMEQIEKMEVQEANWLRESDGAWKCSHCGYRFFNGIGRWYNHCSECGYTMV